VRLTRYAVIVVILTAIGLATVHLRARTTRAGYRLARERVRQRELLGERARLRSALAALKDPDRVTERAVERDMWLLPPQAGAEHRDGRVRTARRRGRSPAR